MIDTKYYILHAKVDKIFISPFSILLFNMQNQVELVCMSSICENLLTHTRMYIIELKLRFYQIFLFTFFFFKKKESSNY